jgi:hypothetical protein
MLEVIDSAGDHLAERTRRRLTPDQEPFEEALAKLHGILADVVREGIANEWPQRKMALAGLYTYCLRGLVNSYRMLLQGYLADAVILLRSAFEGLWLAIDLDIEITQASDETELRVDRWMTGRQHVNMSDVLRRRGEHHARLRDRWNAISRLSHPGNFGAVALAFDKAPIADEPHYQFGVVGIERPDVADVVVDFAWSTALALIKYSPLAFGGTEQVTKETEIWVKNALASQKSFEEKHVVPVSQLLEKLPQTVDDADDD